MHDETAASPVTVAPAPTLPSLRRLEPMTWQQALALLVNGEPPIVFLFVPPIPVTPAPVFVDRLVSARALKTLKPSKFEKSTSRRQENTATRKASVLKNYGDTLQQISVPLLAAFPDATLRSLDHIEFRQAFVNALKAADQKLPVYAAHFLLHDLDSPVSERTVARLYETEHIQPGSLRGQAGRTKRR